MESIRFIYEDVADHGPLDEEKRKGSNLKERLGRVKWISWVKWAGGSKGIALSVKIRSWVNILLDF